MNEQGWIEWKGGEQPVSDDTTIQVLFAEDDESGLEPDLARNFYWGLDPVSAEIGFNIIAYRIVEPGK